MMRSVPHLWLLMPLMTFSVAACSSKSAPAPVAAPAPARTAADPRDAERAAAERRAREAAEEEAAAAARRAAASMKAALEARVFFDYDDAALRGDARRVLDEKARVLRDHPSIRLRVEGHADERGTSEYNLALGSRRAQTVLDYLAGYGIESTRLAAVSLGEERPLSDGHEEGAWSQNRRAEFVITAGELAGGGR